MLNPQISQALMIATRLQRLAYVEDASDSLDSINYSR